MASFDRHGKLYWIQDSISLWGNTRGGFLTTQPLVDPQTGEIIATSNEILTPEQTAQCKATDALAIDEIPWQQSVIAVWYKI